MTGPIILDLHGESLTTEEREILQHPLVGGVILFTRNFVSPTQIADLCRSIRETRSTPFLITVDHEGGRIQRFKQGFTKIPPMAEFGKLFESNPDKAMHDMASCGWLIAQELLAVGIDLSFTPVLDLNKELNTVIGDRAFHRDPMIVIQLAKALIRGMHQCGMAACGKHFPGHGSVSVDSHEDLPIDHRNMADIAAQDMQTFTALITAGIKALMPAHIIYSAVDDKPAGFSEKWLQTILRQQLQFFGMIFSDDLNMQGAKFAGDYPARAIAALRAGCDMVLICNNRLAAIQILDTLPHTHVHAKRFKDLQGKFSETWQSLTHSHVWQRHRNLFLKEEC